MVSRYLLASLCLSSSFAVAAPAKTNKKVKQKRYASEQPVQTAQRTEAAPSENPLPDVTLSRESSSIFADDQMTGVTSTGAINAFDTGVRSMQRNRSQVSTKIVMSQMSGYDRPFGELSSGLVTTASGVMENGVRPYGMLVNYSTERPMDMMTLAGGVSAILNKRVGVSLTVGQDSLRAGDETYSKGYLGVQGLFMLDELEMNLTLSRENQSIGAAVKASDRTNIYAILSREKILLNDLPPVVNYGAGLRTKLSRGLKVGGQLALSRQTIGESVGNALCLGLSVDADISNSLSVGFSASYAHAQSETDVGKISLYEWENVIGATWYL